MTIFKTYQDFTHSMTFPDLENKLVEFHFFVQVFHYLVNRAHEPFCLKTKSKLAAKIKGQNTAGQTPCIKKYTSHRGRQDTHRRSWMHCLVALNQSWVEYFD